MHLQHDPENRDLQHTVPEQYRCTPELWNNPNTPLHPYYKYGYFAKIRGIELPGGGEFIGDEHELHPSSSEYPQWAKGDGYLQNLSSILTFWYGILQPDEIKEFLYGAIRCVADEAYVQQRIATIHRFNDSVHNVLN